MPVEEPGASLQLDGRRQPPPAPSRLGPWDNHLHDQELQRLAGDLEPWPLDPACRVVCGVSGLAGTGADAAAGPSGGVVLVGSDVSGLLHLGHLYNFLAARVFAHLFGARLALSLNEPESVLSRDDTVVSVAAHRARLVATVEAHGIAVHSRIADERLTLLAFLLFKELTAHPDRADLRRFYGAAPGAADLLSVCAMAAAPAALAAAHGAARVIAVYGRDELAHLCLMGHLYRAEWFRRLVEDKGGWGCPRFGFAVTQLIPGADGAAKMSKTLPHQALPLQSVGGGGATASGEARLRLSDLLDFVDRLAPGLRDDSLYLLVRDLVREP